MYKSQGLAGVTGFAPALCGLEGAVSVGDVVSLEELDDQGLLIEAFGCDVLRWGRVVSIRALLVFISRIRFCRRRRQRRLRSGGSLTTLPIHLHHYGGGVGGWNGYWYCDRDIENIRNKK